MPRHQTKKRTYRIPSDIEDMMEDLVASRLYVMVDGERHYLYNRTKVIIAAVRFLSDSLKKLSKGVKNVENQPSDYGRDRSGERRDESSGSADNSVVGQENCQPSDPGG